MPSRLFLGTRTVAQWRALCQTTHRARLERLLKQANSYLEWLPPREHPRETITYIGMAVANLGLAFVLTEQPRYLEAARQWIAVALGYPHWGRAHLPDQDLDAAWLCFGLGLAYDWLGDALPDDERQALRARLLRQGLRLYDFALEREGDWWSSAYWQNHNWICYTGLAAAAFALLREHPEAGAWSERALENFRRVMALLPEDGSDYEGVVYWCYGVPWLLIACDLLQQQTGVDLHDTAFLRNTFYYRLYTSAPNLIDTANYGDCHDRRSAHAAAIYYRLASLYRNGHAQWLADHFERTGEWEREGREGLLRPGLLPQAFLELLWYDPTVAPTPIHDLPLVRAFPDLGLVSARSDWGPQATFLAFKCGAPSGHKAWALGQAINRQRGWQTLKASHAHPDENSFVLMRGGDYLAVDEGYSKAKQTRHHSTLLVDGQGQYREGRYNAFEDTDATWCGRLEDWFAGGGAVYARGEAAAAYDPALGLQRFTRQLLLPGERHVLLCDDVAASVPRAFTWLLQTDAPAQPAAANQFVVVAGATRLRVTVLLPGQPGWHVADEEIVANPSASTPDWVLRHRQYTLGLSSHQPAAALRFLVLLSIEEPAAPAPGVQRLACTAGHGVRVGADAGEIMAGFADGRRGIRAEGLVTDARWIAARLTREQELLSLAAGEATQVWIAGQLRFTSAAPMNVTLEGTTWTVRATTGGWISLWAPVVPSVVLIDGAPVAAQIERTLLLVRVCVSPGTTHVQLGKEGG